MSLQAALAWGCGLWIAAGLEAAGGGGMPGPLWVVTLAAGFWAGPLAGALIGLGAGYCESVLSGSGAVLYPLLGAAGGVAASLLTRWVARTNLLNALLAALVLTVLVTALLGCADGMPLSSLLRESLRRGLVAALWMLVLYGSIIMISRPGRRDKMLRKWEL